MENSTYAELRRQDLQQYRRGEIIPLEILEQEHWIGVEKDINPQKYQQKLRERFDFIESEFSKKGQKIVCKQTNFGIELLYGINAMIYLDQRMASLKKTFIKTGNKLDSHISRHDLNEVQRKMLENKQTRHAMIKQAIALAEAKAFIAENEKNNQPQTQSVSVSM